MLFNRKKKGEKFLEERSSRLKELDLNELKSEPFVLDTSITIPMGTNISLSGEVKSGIYEIGDEIGVESEGQVIHSKDYDVRIPGLALSKEEIHTVYKGDFVEFIFNDIVAKLVDENANVVANPWKELHPEECE